MSGRAGNGDRGRLRAVLALRPPALGGRRGTVLALVLAAAAVAAGMTLGSGVADSRTRSGYDLAWLADGKRGQLVQVDPVLGRANVRLQVADPGSTLSVQQGNGQLIVTDRTTGRITSIDLGTLLVGGSRSARPGDSVKVLLAGSRLYVADLARGTVQAVDPATQADIGTPWSAGRPLVDVGVDGTNAVWALDSTKLLRTLRWDGGTLRPVTTRSVAGAGPGSVIVGHDRGVTVVGSGGAVVTVGTGRDRRLDAPRIDGTLHGPGRSPDDLVPVSSPGTSSVIIVGPGDAVVDDVGGYGCDRPAAPTVFDGKVYVPCSGAGKVIVLGPDGRQVGAAIPTPGGGDPQLTVSGGRLVIDVPGSGSATVVDGSGNRHDFPTVAPGVGVQNPNDPPPDPPAPPTPKPSPPRAGHQDDGDDGDNGDNGGNGDNGNGHGGFGSGTGHGNRPGGLGGDPSGGPSSPGGSGSNGPGSSSGAAHAEARPDGSVVVTWSGGSGSTVITATATGDEVATVPSGAQSATVTVLAPGTTTAFTVRNSAMTATTNSVTTTTAPGAASAVTVTPQGVADGFATLVVTWRAASANGTRVSYAVGPKGGALTTTTSALTATVRVPCSNGCTGTIVVTPRNAAGAGAAASAAYSVAGSAPAPAPTTAVPAPQPQPEPTTAAPAPAPQPVAMPAGGEALITTSASVGSDTAGTAAVAHVTITSPGDWAAFGGTCTLYADGIAQTGTLSSCNVSGQVVDFPYGESGTHEFWVVATDPATGRTSESAHASQSVVYRQMCLNSAGERQLAGPGGAPLQRPICDEPPTCPGCQIPLMQPLQPSTEPAALPALFEYTRRMW
ncbi:hypothetical protein GCM10027265_30510 [Jatrophihabitans fulvus]